MIKKCVVLNGKVINVGEWDYQYTDVDGEQVAQNPLPEGAVIEERDFEYLLEYGWHEVKSLDEQKEIKINKLKVACSNAIFEGFTVDINSESFSFGFNELDQMNFTQQMVLIISGDVSEINWKTDKGVQLFTVDEFKLVIEAGKNHKLTQQNKYWQLEQQVINATTKEEVEAVNW